MVYVITFEAPYSPVWEEGVLRPLVFSALQAAEEAPVILRASKEWAEEIFKSDLMELFVDYIRPDAELVMDMTPYEIRDGLIPHPWDEIFNEVISSRDAHKGLYR